MLKIQYPGIAAICTADLKQVRRLLPLGRLFRAPAAQLEGVYRELEQTITAELDYAAEMQRLIDFRQFFAAYPGNFAYTEEGQLVVYDFGCIQPVEASLLAAYVQTFRALQSGKAEELERGFQALGTRQPQSAPPWALYRNLTVLLGPLLQPGVLWDFAARPVHDQVQQLIPDALSALGSLQPAPGTSMTVQKRPRSSKKLKVHRYS